MGRKHVNDTERRVVVAVRISPAARTIHRERLRPGERLSDRLRAIIERSARRLRKAA